MVIAGTATRRIEPAATPSTIEAADGEVLELALDRAWYLTRGEVLVSIGARPIEVWRAPCPLDLAGSVRGVRSARFVAAGGATAVGMPLRAVPPDRLIDELARESDQLWKRIDADARREDDLYLPDGGARPEPGPWQFSDARAIALVMAGDPARIRACLPPRLRPLPMLGGRYLLVIARFEGVGAVEPSTERAGERFAYHEVTPFIPVWSGLRAPAAYIPELYPDAAMACVLGREIHGFPKRLARIGFHAGGAELVIDRRLALRVRWDGMRTLEPAAGLGALAGAFTGMPLVERAASRLLRRLDDLRMSVIVRKQIGAAATAGRTCEIDRLVRVPFELDELRGAARLDGLEVDVGAGQGILHGRAVAGFELRTGFRFGAGRDEGRP